MDEARKLVANLLAGFRSGEKGMKTETDRGTDPAGTATPPVPAEPQIPTKERALDRWFRERHGDRPPRRINVPNEALVTNAGPLEFTGNITLIEEDGTVTHHNHLTLCRCGASKHAPFCDDQHLEVEFFDSGTISSASDCQPVHRPQTVTLKVIKDGPITFRGFLRVFNKKGQEFVTTQGHLCRCGKSSNKPFCDCRFKKAGAFGYRR